MFCHKLLVLTGQSCFGETLYGLWLEGESKTLVVDCGPVFHPDLRPFSHVYHTAVVFVKCSAATTVVNDGKLFQGLAGPQPDQHLHIQGLAARREAPRHHDERLG